MKHDGRNWVLQKDVARLRETLSRVYKYAPKNIQKIITDELELFANNVGKYCKHPDVVLVAKENKFACLDCGIRREPVESDVKKGLRVIK